MKKKILILSLSLILISIIVASFFIINNKVEYGKNAFYIENNLYNTKDNYEEINSSTVDKLIKEEKNFVLFTYASFCPFSVPSDEIFKSVFKSNKMKLYAISYDKLSNKDVTKKVKYAPSVMIFKKGKIVSYLDAESDKDFDRYQNKKEFRNWLAKYIFLKKDK